MRVSTEWLGMRRGVWGMALAAGLMAACASAPSVPRTSAVAEGVTRVDLGAVKVTMISDGSGARPLDASFVRNASLADVQAAQKAAGLPTDRLEVPYTTLLVDSGKQRILLDTGNGEFGPPTGGKVLANMVRAGIDPESVTAVVISHFHGDHINGLRNKAGELVFPNARVYVPAPEWAWWMDDARMAAAPENARGGFNTARRVFSPIAASVVRFEPGSEVLPGLRSIPAYGHTPGHTAFMVEGGTRKLLYWADTTNVAMFVNNPDWAVVFDMDAEAAKATRHRIADRAIREQVLVAGFHLPPPAVGTLSKQGKGYAFTPLK